jgi:glycolate oxidase
VEFLDGEVFALSARDLKYDFPYERTRAALLIEVDGRFADTVAREADTVADLCRAGQAVAIHRAADAAEAEGFWNIRKRIIWVLKRHAPRQSVEDIVVPIAVITELLPELDAIGRRYGVRIPVYGHAADGNIHATPLKNPDQSDADWEALLPELLRAIYQATARLGGTISGEHGIGHKRRDYMELVMDSAQIDMMRRIKDALDPNHILNPGKILPPQST